MGSYIEHFIKYSFLPYLGSIIHDSSLSDHITNMLKIPTFFCPLGSGFIYPIVYLIFSLEHYKGTSNSVWPKLMILSLSTEPDFWVPYFLLGKAEARESFLTSPSSMLCISNSPPSSVHLISKQLSRVSTHFISTPTLFKFLPSLTA